MTHQCQCPTCADHRRWFEALTPQTPNAQKALEEILVRLEAAETDAVYWRMKHQGTWGPTKEGA